MKIKALPFLLFLLLNTIFVSADILEVIKEDYRPGETLQATLQLENFQVSRLSLLDNSSNKITIGFRSFKKTDMQYAVYFNIPTSLAKGEYTLKYKDIGIEGTDNFKIINGTKSISINPPIVKPKPSQTSFEITLKNNGPTDTTVQISASDILVLPARESILIPVGESRKLFVNHGKLTSTSTLQISYDNRQHTIEIFVEGPETPEEPITSEEPIEERANGLILVDTRPIVHTISQKQVIEGALEFTNILNTPIHNITFHLTPSLADIIDLNVSTLDILEAESTYSQFLWVNKNQNKLPGLYSGILLIKSIEGDSTTLKLNITITEAIDPTDEIIVEPSIIEDEIVDDDDGYIYGDPIEDSQIEVTGVSELGNGTFLGDIQLVDGEVSSSDNNNKLIGIILLAIILIIGGLLIWKLRPKERRVAFKDYINPLRKGYQKKKN